MAAHSEMTEHLQGIENVSPVIKRQGEMKLQSKITILPPQRSYSQKLSPSITQAQEPPADHKHQIEIPGAEIRIKNSSLQPREKFCHQVYVTSVSFYPFVIVIAS